MILIVALIVIVIVYKRALTGTIRAVHQQPKPGQNLVIRAGFLFYFFFCTGWVTGCLFLHRDPARVQAVQKKIVTRVLTRALTRL